MSLPPLPEPDVVLDMDWNYRDVYDSFDMREYGALCRKQEREACILDIKLNTPRNGHSSPENKLRDKLIAAIEARGEKS